MDEWKRLEIEHDINTALTILSLRVQMLRRHSPPDGMLGRKLLEINESVNEVRAASGRLLSRVGGSGYEAGALESDDNAGPEDQGQHIVIVNDDTSFLRLMRDLLSKEGGRRVSTSFVGGEAYRIVRDLQPDLVVLDLVLGSNATGGWRALDLLTLDPVTRHIPVIVCSAATVQLHQHEEWLARFDVHVLLKPFDLASLLDKINLTLEMHRGASAGTED